MNLTISKDQQDVIERVGKVKLDGLSHLIQNVREVGWAWEGNERQILTIDLSNASCTLNFRVWGVAIEGETVLWLVHLEEARYTSEPIDWETAIIIINFKDRADRRDGLFILVEISKIVQRIWHGRFSVWCGEINSNMQVNLPSRTKVFNKRRFFNYINEFNLQPSSLSSGIYINHFKLSAIQEILNGDFTTAKVYVLSAASI